MQNQIQNPYSSSTGSLRKQTHLWDYIHIVGKHYLAVVLVTVVSVLCAVVITQRQPKLYRATAALEILPPWSSGRDASLGPSLLSDDRYLTTQLNLLRKPAVIERAVQFGKLGDVKGFQGMPTRDIVNQIAGNVTVNLVRNSYEVQVSVTGENPSVLDDAANAIVRNFQAMQKSEGKALRDSQKSVLNQKIEGATSAVRFLEMEKQSRLQGQGFTEQTFVVEDESIRKELEKYTERRADVNIEILEKQDLQKQFTDALTEGTEEAFDKLESHPDVQNHAVVREITDQIESLRDQLKNVVRSKSAGSNDPEVIKIQGQIEALTALRKRKIREVVNRFVQQFESRQSEREKLDGYILALQSKLETNASIKNDVDYKNREIERYTREKEQSQTEFDRLNALYQEDQDTVRVAQDATEPTDPVSPNKPLNLTLGVVLGLIGGVALAFLRDYLDDTVRTKDELALIAPDVPLLGIVPNIEARKSDVTAKDLYAHAKPKSTISEAYRGVRTALTLSAKGPQQRVLLLTSAGPREGKTTTSINLATVLGYSGARTLIIDGDLRKPRIHKSFSRPNTEGLTNAIVNGGDPNQYCVSTDVERVDLMPSGPIPPNPSELLGRPRMREIIDRLRQTYDTIIIDTPPIGAVTDAAVIATLVDAVILVVHAGKTRRQIVSRGIEQLRYINAPIAGVILNNLRLGRGRYYPGYYHYYYYYTSYYGADERSVRGKDAKVAAKSKDKSNKEA